MSQGLFYEASYSSLCKDGESVCGDKVEIVKSAGSVMAVLSDGLGSGIKANVLSTLTTRIASYMLKEGSDIDDVVDTIGKTLPICQVRGVAYSTFSIVRLTPDGLGNIVEFDTPDAFLYREGTVTKISTRPRKVAQKQVLEGEFAVKDGDHIFMVSDGVMHAGLGDVMNLGWQWENVAEYLRRAVPKARGDSAQLKAADRRLRPVLRRQAGGRHDSGLHSRKAAQDDCSCHRPAKEEGARRRDGEEVHAQTRPEDHLRGGHREPVRKGARGEHGDRPQHWGGRDTSDGQDEGSGHGHRGHYHTHQGA